MHLMSKGNDYFSSTGSDNYGPVPVRCMFGVFRTTLFGTHNCQVWSRGRMPLTKYMAIRNNTPEPQQEASPNSTMYFS